MDASDVVQDALLEASRRIDQYTADDSMPFFLWLRWLARQRMIEVGRQHSGREEIRGLIAVAVAGLRSLDRQIFTLRAADSYGHCSASVKL